MSCFASENGGLGGGLFGGILQTIFNHVNFGIESGQGVDPQAVLEDSATVASGVLGTHLLLNAVNPCTAPKPKLRKPRNPRACHHLIPLEMFKNPVFLVTLTIAGIKSQNIENAIEIDIDTHDRLHGNAPDGRGGEWNRKWRKFMKRYPKATKPQIIAFRNRTMRQLGVPKSKNPIRTWSKPGNCIKPFMKQGLK